MAFSRELFTQRIKINGKSAIGTSQASRKIFRAVKNNTIKYHTRIMKAGERLDIIAAQVYGDSIHWWVIAAASGIGWSLQVPPGTYLFIPTNLADAIALTR